jgi:hypothetical protein
MSLSLKRFVFIDQIYKFYWEIIRLNLLILKILLECPEIFLDINVVYLHIFPVISCCDQLILELLNGSCCPLLFDFDIHDIWIGMFKFQIDIVSCILECLI